MDIYGKTQKNYKCSLNETKYLKSRNQLLTTQPSQQSIGVVGNFADAAKGKLSEVTRFTDNTFK